MGREKGLHETASPKRLRKKLKKKKDAIYRKNEMEGNGGGSSFLPLDNKGLGGDETPIMNSRGLMLLGWERGGEYRRKDDHSCVATSQGSRITVGRAQ